MSVDGIDVFEFKSTQVTLFLMFFKKMATKIIRILERYLTKTAFFSSYFLMFELMLIQARLVCKRFLTKLALKPMFHFVILDKYNI